MLTIDWLSWLAPALKLQLNWADRQNSVLCAIPSEATPLLVNSHLSRLQTVSIAKRGSKRSILQGFEPAPAMEADLPIPAMLNYEGSTLVDVISAPLLEALIVDTSTAARVAVSERTGGAVLCSLETGGFDPEVENSEAQRQLQALIELVPSRQPQDIDLIQAQAATAWPFVLAACGRPFEHRQATRAVLDVGLAVLHPLIARSKHHLNVERPQHAGLTIAVAMPGHQSAPSGHAAVAYLLAGLLAPLQPAALPRARLFAAAAAVAANRELAGVHFASDSQAGQALGLSLASWLTGLAVEREAFGAVFNMNAGALPVFSRFAAATVAAPEWRWLYQRARAEWT